MAPPSQKWSCFKNGPYFGSYLAPFHENGTTVLKRYYFSSSGAQFSIFYLCRNGPFFKEVELKWLLKQYLKQYFHFVLSVNVCVGDTM